MTPVLLRINSTGRTGSSYLYHYFKFIGYESYHENFREFLPIQSEVYNFFQAEIMEIWNTSTVDFYKLNKNVSFPNLYSNVLQKRFFYQKLLLKRTKLLIDTDNTTTPSTLMLLEKLSECGLSFKGITLFRNPFKTIHSIYLVERAGGYLYRARSIFSSSDNVVRAAEIWHSTYKMCIDFEKMHSEKFFRLNVEDFNSNIDLIRSLYDFIGVHFDLVRYKEFIQQDRVSSATTNSIRNSDLHHSFEFVFNSEELDKIEISVSSTALALGLDIKEERRKYVDFHKNRLGHISR